MTARRKTTAKKQPEPETRTYRARQAAAGLRAGELFAGDETHPVVRAGLAEVVQAEEDPSRAEAPPEVAGLLEVGTPEPASEAVGNEGLPAS